MFADYKEWQSLSAGAVKLKRRVDVYPMVGGDVDGSCPALIALVFNPNNV
jgi:hypothetical protein